MTAGCSIRRWTIRISNSRCETAPSRSATSAAGRRSSQERNCTSRFRARDRACSMSGGAHCSDATRRCTHPTKRAYEAFKRSVSHCPESFSSDVHNYCIKWLFSKKRRFFDGFFLILMSFHFSRFFSFTFLPYNSICAELQGGPRERKEASRQKTASPGVSDSGAR